MRVDGAMVMACKEQGEENRARLANILATAFSGNEGSGDECRRRRAPVLRLVTPYYVVRCLSQPTEHNTAIITTQSGRSIKKARMLFPQSLRCGERIQGLCRFFPFKQKVNKTKFFVGMMTKVRNN